MAVTISTLVSRAIAAHEALEATAEPVEDEWQYVVDLCATWRARLRAVADARSDDAPADVAAAVQRTIDEAGLVTDPHRAIDWLSTLPQVVLLALGETT
jgi:hypothetical protein